MLFSSIAFLYFFLPVTLLLYFLTPRRFRNITLLLLSLLFYAWSGLSYLLLMLLVIVMNGLFGLWIGAKRGGKAVLALAVFSNLAILIYFKYTDFLRSDVLGFSPLGIVLPVGISFYIFQAMSYLIDVYRGDAEVQRKPVRFALYVALFPQLVAGPIVRYREIDTALSSRGETVFDIPYGLVTFAVGLGKKVLLANSFGTLWEKTHALPTEDLSTVGAWMGLLAYAFQIYFDFSGYSDMAIGLGRIFGFRFPENFLYPYTARSVTDFWRRWHISLSSWFREYVYIPLGGNRRGKGRMYLNLLIVWILTGLWHGASWNFLLWGLYYALLLIAEKAFLLSSLERAPRVVRHGYAILCILIGWLIFAFDGSAETLSAAHALRYGKKLFLVGSPFFMGVDLYEILRNAILFAIATFAALPYPKRLFCRLYDGKWRGAALTLAFLGAFAIFLLSTAYLVDSSYNPFLYFRF